MTQPALAGQKFGPPGAGISLLDRGSVAAPPTVPVDILRRAAGVPRGLGPTPIDYLFHVQRRHGNRHATGLLAGPSAVPPPREEAAAPALRRDVPGVGLVSADCAVSPTGTVPDAQIQPKREIRSATFGGDRAGLDEPEAVRRAVEPVRGAPSPAPVPRLQRGIWDSIVSGYSAVGGAIAGGAQAVGGALAQGASFLFEQGLRLAGVPGDLMAILRRAGSAFDRIVDDPLAFLRHLLDAVMGGFCRFADNIRTHIANGLVGWLTGALGGAGIRLPRRFDLAGIFDLALQVLGFTADRIREKVGRVIGPQNVQRIEGVWNVISRLISGGLGGLWEMVRGYLADLQEMVLGPVKEWAITQLVQQAVLRLVSMFNPAGAVVEAIRVIWNVIQFLRTRGQQLFAVFARVLEAIAPITTGSVGGAAAAIEQTLARMIPPVLDFLARLIGLGDIATPVRRAIEAIRAPIDRVLDRVIGAIANGLRGAAGALGRLLGRGGGSGAAADETEAARQQRLREGVRAGATAFNRFSGRPVGERALRPLLWTIKMRYRLGVLEPVIEGENWAVHGELRRMTESTGAKAPGGGGGGDAHRGRIQVQGRDLREELSWPWASAQPPTGAAALTGLRDMRDRLNRAELALRDQAFTRAERFIQNAQSSGGVTAPVSVTFQNRGLPRANRDARVDIEVRTGRAFV